MSAAETVPPDNFVVDEEDFVQWLGTKNMAWQPLSRGEYNVTLEQAQLFYICEDMPRWCQAFMREPDTDEPYVFWGYQLASARSYDQNVVHQDGSEVGKTREIAAMILWGSITGFGYRLKNPSILVGAPMQSHLDEIIMDVEKHMGEGDAAGSSDKPIINRCWLKPKRHPHTMHKLKGWTCSKNNIAQVYYRPAGHDGEAFRGVHVNGQLIMDEAAKVKNKVCWSEFFRAGKPGCKKRVYSVPDGDNTSRFHAFTQEADTDLKPGEEGWRLFHWPKTLMPPPFWTPGRDRELQQLYAGRDEPGYQRNVLGLHGQQENPVWSYDLLQSNIKDTPEYRALKLVADSSNNNLHIYAYRVERLPGKDKYKEITITDRTESLSSFQDGDNSTRRESILRLLREFFEYLGDGVYYAGADLGFAKDPTEIIFRREQGQELRRVLRIHLKGVKYTLQCEIIYCIDKIFNMNAQWGVDFGNAGTMVVQHLQDDDAFEDANYEQRLTGFAFGTSVAAVNEDGDVLEEEDKDGNMKAVKLPAKELATNLITRRLQDRTFTGALDYEIMNHYSNHTAREGAKHRIFSKDNDHTIDAERAMLLRKAFSNEGAADVFASGVFIRGAA